MQKYRENTLKRIDETKLDFLSVAGSFNDCKCTPIIEKKSKEFNELVEMFSKTIEDHSNEINKLLEDNTRLHTENQTLRKILQASNDIKETQSVGCEWSFQQWDLDVSDELDTSQETVKSQN